jgi:DHA1 family bicyclomycin/chloramphenicol resistance-like MFS transporter
MAVIAVLAVIRLLPETLPQRADTDRPMSLSFMMHSYREVARHRGFLAYLGIITASYAGLFAWVAGASVVLQSVYGLSPAAFGFTFAFGSAGYLVGTTIAMRIVLRRGLDRTIGIGVILLVAGGVALAAVVAARIGGTWLVASMSLYLAGLGFAMPQAMAGALTPFARRAGTASSLMGVVQQTVAAVVAAVLGGYLSRSAWPVAAVILGMSIIAYLFWALTRRLREHER